MTTAEKQNGADSPQKGAKAPSQDSDLETLLKGYDEAQPKLDTADILKKFEPVAKFAEKKMLEDEALELKAGIDSAVDFLLEPDEAKATPKKLVKGFLRDYAADNPEFAKAFTEQKQHPRVWSRELGSARDAFLEEIKGLSKGNDRADVEAAKAAVKGSKTQAPVEDDATPAQMFAMSDQEWKAHVAQSLAKS